MKAQDVKTVFADWGFDFSEIRLLFSYEYQEGRFKKPFFQP